MGDLAHGAAREIDDATDAAHVSSQEQMRDELLQCPRLDRLSIAHTISTASAPTQLPMNPTISGE